MTPNDLKKEAERIYDHFQNPVFNRSHLLGELDALLRNVHNAAIEKAATVASGALVNHSHVFRGDDRTLCDTGFSGERNECVIDLIRALKIGDGKP